MLHVPPMHGSICADLQHERMIALLCTGALQAVNYMAESDKNS